MCLNLSTLYISLGYHSRSIKTSCFSLKAHKWQWGHMIIWPKVDHLTAAQSQICKLKSPEVICFGCWPKLPYKTPSDPLDPWKEPAGDLFQVGETDVTRSIPSHLVFPYGVLLKLKQGSTQRHTQTPITVSTSNTKMQNLVCSPQ